MTLYEFMVPVVLLAIAGIGMVAVHFAEKRLDARLEAERKANHPAE